MVEYDQDYEHVGPGTDDYFGSYTLSLDGGDPVGPFVGYTDDDMNMVYLVHSITAGPGSVYYDAVTNPIPEPNTLTMVILGGLMLVLFIRRSRS